jgi:hypothetical protein
MHWHRGTNGWVTGENFPGILTIVRRAILRRLSACRRKPQYDARPFTWRNQTSRAGCAADPRSAHRRACGPRPETEWPTPWFRAKGRVPRRHQSMVACSRAYGGTACRSGRTRGRLRLVDAARRCADRARVRQHSVLTCEPAHSSVPAPTLGVPVLPDASHGARARAVCAGQPRFAATHVRRHAVLRPETLRRGHGAGSHTSPAQPLSTASLAHQRPCGLGEVL